MSQEVDINKARDMLKEAFPMTENMTQKMAVYKNGKVTGLKGRGAFEVSMEWEQGELRSLEIVSLKGSVLNVRYMGRVLTRDTKAGESYSFTSTDFK